MYGSHHHSCISEQSVLNTDQAASMTFVQASCNRESGASSCSWGASCADVCCSEVRRDAKKRLRESELADAEPLSQLCAAAELLFARQRHTSCIELQDFIDTQGNDDPFMLVA